MTNEEEYSQEPGAQKEEPPVLVPFEVLSEEALVGVIDNFIQREGTDYGHREVSYDSKIEQVRKQIEKGEVKIVFDPNTESIMLLTKHQWTKLSGRDR